MVLVLRFLSYPFEPKIVDISAKQANPSMESCYITRFKEREHKKEGYLPTATLLPT
jgi:hypothetical protein